MNDQKLHKSRIVFAVILSFILILGFLISYTFADDVNPQIVSTTNGSLDVNLLTVPSAPIINEDTKLKIDFVNPQTQKIQEDVDYRISIEKNAVIIFETNLTHTSTGSITIPFKFKESGSYDVYVDVFGIFSSPIHKETALFTISIDKPATEEHDLYHENEYSIEEIHDQPIHEHMDDTTEGHHVHNSVTAEAAKWVGLGTLLVTTPVLAIRIRSANKLGYKDVVLTLALGVGIMHVLLAPDHLIDVGMEHGIFFAIVGSAQIGFGLIFISKPTRGLAIIGATGSIASIILYFITRIEHLPEPFTAPEGIDQVGIIVKIAEASLAAILIYLMAYLRKSKPVDIAKETKKN